MDAESSSSIITNSPSHFSKAVSAGDHSKSRIMDEETPANKLNFESGTFSKINESTRRLVVHSIMLENFKSYEGRQEIGPFDDVHTSNTEIRGSDRPERFR